MGVRTVVSAAIHHGKIHAKNHNSIFQPLLSCAPVTASHARSVHLQHLTKNLQYITNDNQKLKTDPNTMKLNKDIDKPLCIIMNWMLAKESHVMKYATLYLEQGFDVVSVSCSPWQLMWPVTGSQLIAMDLLKFMTENNHKPLVVHGFSVGGYVWGEALVHAEKNKQLYKPTLDRVVAQVWDSAADITEIPVGFPSAVFPRNKIFQNTLRTYTKYHLKKFHESATKHYLLSSQTYHQTPCRAPALFLLSKSDPVGAERSNRSVHDSWQKLGMQCTWKCWDRSPHVLHYMKHPSEYLHALYKHLDSCGVITNPDKMNKRLQATL